MRSLLIVLTGCATTANVCPSGTKLVREQKRAQWCASTAKTIDRMPVPAHGATKFDDALGISQPTGFDGGVSGPFTSWHANGQIESQGTYVDLGARSVADGVWRFWHPTGQKWVVGTYRHGVPTGCFAVWDEQGVRRTGFVEGTQLRVSECEAPIEPIDDGVQRVRGDLAFRTFVGSGGFGARNAEQLDGDPSLLAGFSGQVRYRWRRLRVGPQGTFRVSDNTSYQAFGFGGALALELPSPHPRLDLELAAELGVQRIGATARRPQMEQPGTGAVEFWTPLAALQLGGAITLSNTLQLLVAVRADGAPIREVEKMVTYCDFLGCFVPRNETWEVGGWTYGVDLGLRILLH